MMLSREELLRMFESAGAIRHGHFELSSGLHSGTYVQCALVLQLPSTGQGSSVKERAASEWTIEALTP